MALEAVVYPQDSLFGYSSIGAWSFYEFGNFFGVDEDYANVNIHECNVNSSSTLENEAMTRPRKRRRVKSQKNKEEVESQRMTHIAVERNRRRQMNEYLAVLRSLMPPSYAQRGDQASIVGGAITFVKELEHLLQTLEAQKHVNNKRSSNGATPKSSPFASFFIFPQYSCNHSEINKNGIKTQGGISTDIEVTMIESHVNLKVRLRRQPKQLLNMVTGLQSLCLTTLHLNVTTATNQMVLYSFSLKVEDDCQFTSVDEIAAAVHQMIKRINQHENICT